MGAWMMASLIMIFVTAIAVFYQKRFGIKTYYYLYFIPIIILFISGLMSILYPIELKELVELSGSLGAFIASFYLYRLMVGVKK